MCVLHVKATEKYFLTSSIYAVYIYTNTHIIHNVQTHSTFFSFTHTKKHTHIQLGWDMEYGMVNEEKKKEWCIIIHRTHVVYLCIYLLYRNDMGGNIKKVKIYEVLHLKDFHFHVFHAFTCSNTLSVGLESQTICVWENLRSDGVSIYLTFSYACCMI